MAGEPTRTSHRILTKTDSSYCARTSPTGNGHGLQLAPPKYSEILTWSVSSTRTGADTRRTIAHGEEC